jgi:hypothetical protein
VCFGASAQLAALLLVWLVCELLAGLVVLLMVLRERCNPASEQL